MGAALARWKLGVAESPFNEGLTPKKFLFYDRYHYYQASSRAGCAGRQHRLPCLRMQLHDVAAILPAHAVA